MRILSRSAYEASLQCQRRYFYQFLFARTGLEERKKPIHLAFGLALHKGMEVSMKAYAARENDALMLRSGNSRAALPPEDASVAVNPFPPCPACITVRDGGVKTVFCVEHSPSPTFAIEAEPNYAALAVTAAWDEWARYARGHDDLDEEVRALLHALLLGWWATQSERFLSEWDIVSVEEEGIPIPLAPGVGLAFRIDLAARNKYDGALVVINFKSCSSSWGFQENFESDIQVWTEAECLERTLSEPVIGCVMEGFVKGQLKDGHFSSALIRPWRKDLPEGKRAYSWDWKTVTADYDKQRKGSSPPGQWNRIEVWREVFPTGEFGVEGWLSWLPPEAVAAHFCSTGFLKRPPRPVMDGWLRQMTRAAQDEEHILADGVPLQDQQDFYRQHFSRWTCGSEAKPSCAFRPVCFGQATLDELVEAGTLTEREDHHSLRPETASTRGSS